MVHPAKPLLYGIPVFALAAAAEARPLLQEDSLQLTYNEQPAVADTVWIRVFYRNNLPILILTKSCSCLPPASAEELIALIDKDAFAAHRTKVAKRNEIEVHTENLQVLDPIPIPDDTSFDTGSAADVDSNAEVETDAASPPTAKKAKKKGWRTKHTIGAALTGVLVGGLAVAGVGAEVAYRSKNSPSARGPVGKGEYANIREPLRAQALTFASPFLPPFWKPRHP